MHIKNILFNKVFNLSRDYNGRLIIYHILKICESNKVDTQFYKVIYHLNLFLCSIFLFELGLERY